MIKFLNAVTEEIDDPELAVKELKSALDFKQLKKNSVGIVTCYSEFIDSGVVSLLSKELPFDILGTTTMQNEADGRRGRLMLTLTVLTSDTVEFATGLSGSLFDEREKPIAEMYSRAAGKFKQKPDVMFTFFPLIPHVCGDELVGLLSKVSGGVPNFGTIAVDHTRDYSEARVIFKGAAYKNDMAVLLIKGVKPEFSFVALSDKKIQKQKAIITASSGSLLKEVNGINITKYLNSLGLTPGEGVNVIPFVVDYNDGTNPLARAIYAFTPEGYAACGGEMPIGATLGIGALDLDDILAGTRELLEKNSENKDVSGLVIFSCIGRNLILGADFFAEGNIVEKIAGKVPYLLCYSGGEICPAPANNDKELNKFHNYTMVICRF